MKILDLDRTPAPGNRVLDTIRDGASAADRSGDLVAAHDLMLADGLFHVLVPEDLGGAGASIVDWFDTALDVAHADPAAGWIMAQGAVQNAWLAVAGADEFVAGYFATRKTVATSSAGSVLAERVGDRLVARHANWAYVSGCQGASFVGGLVRTTAADGTPETRMILVGADRATVLPSWDTLGLRGTGSHHVDLGEEVDVPLDHTFTWPRLTVRRPGPLAAVGEYTAWFISLSAAAVNLGAARRAIAEATQSAEHKMHRFDAVPVIQQSPFLRGIARLHGQVDLAAAGLRLLLGEMWSGALGGVSPNASWRARLRLAAAAAIHLGADVTREAQLLIGADSLHRSHPLERLGRDAHMLLNHVATSPATCEQLATVLIGTFDRSPAFV